MANKTSISRGTLYNFVSGMLNVFGGYLTAVIAARFLGPEKFGVYSIVTSVVFVISAVLMTGVQQTTAKFVSERPRNKHEIKYQVFKIQAVVSSLFFALYFFLSPLIAGLFNDRSLVPYIRYCALIIIFQSLFSVFAGYENGLRNFKKQAMLISFYSVLKAILVTGLVVLGYSIIGAITGFVAATFISLLVSLALIGLKRAKPILDSWKIIRFGTSIFLFNVITVMLMNIDLFFVKGFSPIHNANALSGYYNAALQISRAPYYIMSALTLTIFPVVSQLSHKGLKEKIKSQLERAVIYSTIIMGFIVSIFSTTSNQIISLFYGEQYHTASVILMILIFSGALFSLFLLLLTVITAIGEPNKAVLIGLVSLILAFMLNYYLVPRYSYVGAAVASTLTMLVAFIISWGYTKKRFGIKLEGKKIFFTLLSCGVLAVLSIIWPIEGFWIVIKYVALGIMYIAMLYGLKVIQSKDIDFFKRMLFFS